METLKAFSAHCLSELLQKEKEQSPFPLELPWQGWWTCECRAGPELPFMQETVMDNLAETLKDQVRRKYLFPVIYLNKGGGDFSSLCALAISTGYVLYSGFSPK